MSTQPNDGGPAFPIQAAVSGFGDIVKEAKTGMTLRDWFAGQTIPQAYLLNVTVGNDAAVAFETARIAYMIADAMLAKRAEGTK